MRYPRALPLAIFALIAGITILSIFSIERGEDQRAQAQLRSRGLAVASAIERRADSSSAYLRAGAALLSILPDMPFAQFDTFGSELRLDADYRGAQGIGWAPVVTRQGLAAFEQRISEEIGRPLRVYPQPRADQPFLVPVAYLHPNTPRNRRALGFDMYSEQARRAAMDEAERTARPTATRRIVLRQDETGEAPGFLIYMPVFEPTAGGERRLKGFIYSPFDAREFLLSALELETAGDYPVRLYDGPPATAELLASSGELLGGDPERFERTIPVANNPWVLQVSSTDNAGLSGLSMATLIFGLLAASLLMLLVRMLTQQAVEDDRSLVEFEKQASIRNSLTRELNHRVKNTLANVLSIIALTRRRATNLAEFADGLDGRIRALSATHDLLTNSEWDTTPVRAVIEAELRPYAQDSDHVLDLQGPAVQLAPNDALSLGLAIHELATNAAKYGALSAPGGRVSIHWKLVSVHLVQIEWLERGGPPVPQQRGRGFGTDLIERIVPHELKNPVRLVFEPEGVRCVLTIPVRSRTDFEMRAGKRLASLAPAPPPARR
jgi:two-component sensor histidine kinase